MEVRVMRDIRLALASASSTLANQIAYLEQYLINSMGTKTNTQPLEP